MIWIPPAIKLNEPLETFGLVECSDEACGFWARFIMERAEYDDSSRFKLILPRKDRVNAALLGTFTVHDRITLYCPKRNLREVIEGKINRVEGKKGVLAFNSSTTNYCFETDKFSYDQLTELHKKTYAQDFLVALPVPDALFVFHEDAPACFISYSMEENFAADFVSSSGAKAIFSKNMMDWRMTTLPGETKWLEYVRSVQER